MASAGPIQGHWKYILWPVVGPFETIGTIFSHQWWAHSRPSRPYFLASGGPIQGHWKHILWPVMGPFEAIGTIFSSQWWAHLAIGSTFYGQWWACSRSSGP